MIQALFEGFLDVCELGMYEFESSESLVTYFLGPLWIVKQKTDEALSPLKGHYKVDV